ncbi:MAG TPA: heme ABC exporter ATP-binding protein CcmA [Candidatus Binataceae bacterium]|nr:heme ABC exporter ATP-binding protein CcmA [Candidatus Binataceae bacterium]
MDTPLIEARGLSKSYGPAPVLRGVSLTLGAGGGALIVGSNGAGKSTLLRVLAGLSAPTIGSALLFGAPSHTLEASLRARVGLVTHQSFLYPNLTARENLTFYADLYGRPCDASAISRWLERVGLARAAAERVRTFSRGMEQRLTLARALLNRPDALLMDEPFAALDPDGVELACGLLREARERGCAIVLTAHQEFAMPGMAFDCYEIVRGRLLALAEPQREQRRSLKAS